jgi:hypothetical protein
MGWTIREMLLVWIEGKRREGVGGARDRAPHIMTTSKKLPELRDLSGK